MQTGSKSLKDSLTASTSATIKMAKQESAHTKTSSQNVSVNSRNLSQKPPKTSEFDISIFSRVSDPRVSAIDEAAIINQVILEDENGEASPKRHYIEQNLRKQILKQELPLGNGTVLFATTKPVQKSAKPPMPAAY